MMGSRVLLTVLAVALTAGCASLRGYPDRSEEMDTRLESLRSAFFLPNEDIFAKYGTFTGAGEKRNYRNEVVYGRMLAIDLQFAVFTEAIYEEGVVSNLTLDILGVGVGGAGAAVTGVDASRILSALSGGISGTRTAINKNLYYERTMPALMALMEAEREKVKAEIILGLQQETDVYPLGQGLVDLERYFQAGSIPGAIRTVVTTAGARSEQAQSELTVAREAGFTDIAAQHRVEFVLDLADALPSGAAWQVLKNPPSELDSFTASAVQARLGGTSLADAAGTLSGAGNDAQAKQVLKMILVLIDNRSEESLQKWTAVMQALSTTESE